MSDNPIIALTEILSHTPMWVWGVFVLLIWRGLSAAEDREVTAAGNWSSCQPSSSIWP